MARSAGGFVSSLLSASSARSAVRALPGGKACVLNASGRGHQSATWDHQNVGSGGYAHAGVRRNVKPVCAV